MAFSSGSPILSYLDRKSRIAPLRNEVLDLATIVPATAYRSRSYAERYRRSRRYSLQDEQATSGGERDGLSAAGRTQLEENR